MLNSISEKLKSFHGFIEAQNVRTITGIAAALGLTAIAMAFILSGPDQTADVITETEIASLPPLTAKDIHRALDYDLAIVASEKAVPNIIIDSIDVDLRRIPDINEKKETFFRIMLPIIARENDKVRAERAKIMADPESAPKSLYQKYDIDVGNVDELLRRVDVVPASLVLSQAALESGWASSRFALKGNNFFGMRTYNMDAPGMDPHQAEGFKVMIFKDISGSVRAYIKNLNTHNAYKTLRKARATMRRQNAIPSGRKLTNYLTAYSEIPEEYGARLRSMMDRNKLDRFDGVRLADN